MNETTAKPALNLKIDPTIYNKLQEATKQRGQSKTYIVERALEAYLADVDKTTSNVDSRNSYVDEATSNVAGEIESLKKQLSEIADDYVSKLELEERLKDFRENLQEFSRPVEGSDTDTSATRQHTLFPPSDLNQDGSNDDSASQAAETTETEVDSRKATTDVAAEFQLPELPTDWKKPNEMIEFLKAHGIDAKHRKQLSDRAGKGESTEEGYSRFTFRNLEFVRRESPSSKRKSYEYSIIGSNN